MTSYDKRFTGNLFLHLTQDLEQHLFYYNQFSPCFYDQFSIQTIIAIVFLHILSFTIDKVTVPSC